MTRLLSLALGGLLATIPLATARTTRKNRSPC